MKIYNPFKQLNKFEIGLWISSLIIVTLSFILPKEKDVLTLIASLIGVTSLIFMAKGMVFGQALGLVFALFYGIVALIFRYYGEIITYLGMSAPCAVASIITWLKNPYKDTHEVTVSKLSIKTRVLIAVSTVCVTILIYFVLKLLNTPNLIVSSISVATSFLASALLIFRSPFYAIAYSLNDIVLIVLWTLACMVSVSYIPVVVCFTVFLVNDIYAFRNWLKMRKKQSIAQ